MSADYCSCGECKELVCPNQIALLVSEESKSCVRTELGLLVNVMERGISDYLKRGDATSLAVGRALRTLVTALEKRISQDYAPGLTECVDTKLPN